MSRKTKVNNLPALISAVLSTKRKGTIGVYFPCRVQADGTWEIDGNAPRFPVLRRRFVGGCPEGGVEAWWEVDSEGCAEVVLSPSLSWEDRHIRVIKTIGSRAQSRTVAVSKTLGCPPGIGWQHGPWESI